MTTEALPAPIARTTRSRLDISGAVMALFAAVLCLLVILPIGWLVVFAFTDRARNVTLANFHTLFTDPVFVEPLATTLIIATSVSLVCCAVAAPLGWIVARTDMPLRRAIRVLVMASFVTPPFLGAIAWELLAAPNSGLLNQLYRAATGAGPDAVLFDIYTLTGLIFVISCYTFPYVFVLVANALDRIPGDLEDASSMLGGRAWRTARRVTIPLALPALLAGALVAFLQAMTLFGSPAILALPAGFHTMTTKIWSLFQYPPKPELAAAASLPLLLLTVALLRAQSAVLGRRGYAVVGGKSGPPRLVRLGPLRWPALCMCFAALCLPVFLPYGALLNAAFSRIPSQLLTFDTVTLHNIRFVFFELSATKLAMKNTFLLGALAATAPRCSPWWSPISPRAPPSPATGCWVSWPPRRSPYPASCSASACSSPTRAGPSCSTARCGSCCSPTSRSSCRPPTSSCSPRSARSRPNWRRRDASSAPRACARCATSPRRCLAPAWSPPGASCSWPWCASCPPP